MLVTDNMRITDKFVQKVIEDMDVEPLKRMAAQFDTAGAGAIDIIQ